MRNVNTVDRFVRCMISETVTQVRRQGIMQVVVALRDLEGLFEQGRARYRVLNSNRFPYIVRSITLSTDVDRNRFSHFDLQAHSASSHHPR